MVDLWFYGRGSDISGPVSGADLAALADRGRVLPTDTVWRDGVELGERAGDSAEFFPAVPTGTGVLAGTRARKHGRAVAGKGAVIVSQDGATVKYRMKCTTCGRDDASWKSMPIPHGVARNGFFCQKCRKRRDAEIHGYH